jgi:hypothetical protein
VASEIDDTRDWRVLRQLNPPTHFCAGSASEGTVAIADLTVVDSSRKSGSAGAPALWSRAPSPTNEELARDLLSLYEQLLAARIELVDHAGPSEDHVTLSRTELDCVVAQIDTAIVSTRQMVSSTVRTPQEPAQVFAIPVTRSPLVTREKTQPITQLENA